MDVLMLDELSSFTCTYNQNMGYIFCIYYCITQTLMKVEVICQTIYSCCELPTDWFEETVAEHTVLRFSQTCNIATPTKIGSSVKPYNRRICCILTWLANCWLYTTKASNCWGLP